MKRALYRKYRPTRLDDVIGQDHITKPLSEAIKQGKISHAYLFSGPRGTGKTSIARIFAHAVNELKYEIEDDYVDIIEIDAASNTGVDNIRELREKAIIAPTTGKYKVYIIDEVHMLSKSAFNALLKTLEEPPEHVIFIMATTDAHKVPITITSRAQVYTFRLADQETMLNYLEGVAKKEKISIDKDALGIIVKRGAGSFRDSLSLLDQISTLSDKKITAEMVTEALGLPQDENIKKLLDFYAAKDNDSITTTLKDVLNSGSKPELFVEELIHYIIENPKSEYFNLLSKLSEIKGPFVEAKLLVALLALPKETFVSADAITDPKPIAKTAPITRTRSEITTKPTSKSQGDFNWEDFLSRIHAENSALAGTLKRFRHSVKNETLCLIPTNNLTEKIVSRPDNQELIKKIAPEYSIVIKKAGSEQKNPSISQISAIMGEVQEVNDNGNPF